MARDETLPFERGETYYNGGTINQNDLGGINLEGKVFLAEIRNLRQYSAYKADPSGRKVRLRVVRNRSGVNLLPRKVVRFAVGSANGTYPLGTGVDGYFNAAGDIPAGVVDDLLPAAGVPPGDLFYVVEEGPTQVISPASGTFSIAAGATLAAQTGTSATSADSGQVGVLGGSPTVTNLFTVVGRAESFITTVTTANQVVSAVVHFRFAI